MIYLQISAGHGPDECTIAVAHLVDRIGGRPITRVGRSAIVALDDRNYADSWIGTIKWVREDPIIKNRKRKNWFVGIREVEVPEPGSVNISDDDLEWQTMKSSGKGGQHANKNDTAVRLIHGPTGIVVVSQDERSQKRNKAIALSRLYVAMAKRRADAIKALETQNWSLHNQIERGNPIRTFEGLEFRERTNS